MHGWILKRSILAENRNTKAKKIKKYFLQHRVKSDFRFFSLATAQI